MLLQKLPKIVSQLKYRRVDDINQRIIPGNRNADNVDSELRKYADLIYFPSRSLRSDGLKSGLLKSFGFGQVGGEVSSLFFIVMIIIFIVKNSSYCYFKRFSLCTRNMFWGCCRKPNMKCIATREIAETKPLTSTCTKP